MNKSMFDKLCTILTLVSGDRIDQEDLFTVQDRLTMLLLDEATKNQQVLLTMKFPWYFKRVVLNEKI